MALCVDCTGRDDFHIAVLSNVNSKYVKCFASSEAIDSIYKSIGFTYCLCVHQSCSNISVLCAASRLSDLEDNRADL